MVYFEFLLNDLAPMVFLAMGIAWIMLMMRDIYDGLKHIISTVRDMMSGKGSLGLSKDRPGDRKGFQ